MRSELPGTLVCSFKHLLFLPYNIDDVGGKRRHTRNILQWCKYDFKSKNNTNGDYWLLPNIPVNRKVNSNRPLPRVIVKSNRPNGIFKIVQRMAGKFLFFNQYVHTNNVTIN